MRFLVAVFWSFRGRVRNLVRLGGRRVMSGSSVSGTIPPALPGSVRVRFLVAVFLAFRGRVRNLVPLNDCCVTSGSPALPGSIRVRNLVRPDVTYGSSPLPLALPGSMHSGGVTTGAAVERARLFDFVPVFPLCGVLAHVGTIVFAAENLGIHFSPSSHFNWRHNLFLRAFTPREVSVYFTHTGVVSCIAHRCLLGHSKSLHERSRTHRARALPSTTQTSPVVQDTLKHEGKTSSAA